MASPTLQNLISKMNKDLSPYMRCNSLNVQIPLAEKNIRYCWVRVAVSTWNISRLRITAKKWLQWQKKRVKKKTLKFSVIYCGQVWIGGTLKKPKLYREMDFHYEVWSWNKMKNKTLGSTGVDILNCLHFNAVHICFVSDPWYVLRSRVTHNIMEIICIGKPPWFDNNIQDLNR